MATDFSNLEQVITTVIDHGFQLHDSFGPGLLESAYEAFLAGSLREAGLHVQQQLTLSATYRGTTVDKAFRIDLLVDGKLVIEIKSVEKVAPVHSKQLLTYLRLTGLPVGLLINFGAPFYKNAVSRVIDSRNSYGRQK